MKDVCKHLLAVCDGELSNQDYHDLQAAMRLELLGRVK